MTLHISTRISRMVQQMEGDQAPYLTWRPTGILDFEKVKRTVAYVTDLELSSPQDFNRLIDLRGVSTIDLYYEDLKKIAELRKNAVINCFVKTAIIARDDLSYGMARMYDALMTHPAIEVGLFRDSEEAIEWLSCTQDLLAERLVTA